MSALDALIRQSQIRHFADGGTTADPIAGLYQSVLGRDTPDAAGLQYWQGQLASGQSLGDITAAFQNSPEAQAKAAATPSGGNVTVQAAGPQYDNAQPIAPSYGSTNAIQNWYETNLGRPAEQAGLDFWGKSFGATLDPNEITQLQASPEYTNRQAVAGIYETELGRKAAEDAAGLDYWAGLANTGTPLQDIRQGISGSSEGQTFDLSQLYKDEFNRTPDAPGLEYWQNQLASGASLGDVQKSFNESKEGIGYDIGNLYENVLGRKPDEPGLQSWLDAVEKGVPREEILKSFQQAPEYQVAEDFQKYLGRAPEGEGSQYYQEQLASGRDPREIEREIAWSQESIGTNAPSVKAVLEATLGKDIVAGLTPEQISEYTKSIIDPARANKIAKVSAEDFDPSYYLTQNPDVAAAGLDPYTHYSQYGINEGRAGNAEAAKQTYATESQNLLEVYKQIALDPVLGPKLRAENPLLWEKVTPLANRPEELVRTDRAVYGQYGTVDVGGIKVPILNGQRVDQMFGDENSGTYSDFSHGRGNLTANLGWSSNSFSGKLSKGADAFGVTKTESEYGTDYSGLNEAAKLLNIDTSQFKDKQVPVLTKDVVDDFGNVIVKGGQPAYQTDENGYPVTDFSGNPIPVTRNVTAQDQLYDAVGKAAKDYFLYTGDSLTPGQGVEGGAKSFDTVLYKREGDELIPITAPVSHGGYQNMDVYTGGSGFNFMKDIAPGLIFVGAGALAMVTAGASLAATAAAEAATATALAAGASAEAAAAAGAAAAAAVPSFATTVGATLLGLEGTAASIAGGAILGGSLASANAAVSGGNVGMSALSGAVTGGIANAMGPVLQAADMGSTIEAVSSATNGLYSPSQVANIVSSSFANAVGTAVGGGSGDKIFKSFGTALAANGISQAGVTAITNGLKDVFDADTVAKIARASQIVSNTVATSALTGKNQQQIVQSLITQFANPSNLIGSVASVATATDPNAKVAVDTASPTNPNATENVGLTTGAVDATLQKPIIVDEILAGSTDPIASMNAINNWTGNQTQNAQVITSDMLNQGMSKPDIVNNIQSLYGVDQSVASKLFQGAVTAIAIDKLANNSSDPIAVFNAATMATGDKNANLKYITDEMTKQGLTRPEVSKNLQDIYQIPEKKADAYANQVLREQPFVSKADNFNDAFKEARAAGVKQFEFDGKQFNTNLAPAPAATTAVSPRDQELVAQPGDKSLIPGFGPQARTFQQAVDFAKDTAPITNPTTKGLGDRLTDPNRAYPETFAKYADRTLEGLNQKITPFIENPENILPAAKEVISDLANSYKDSLLATGGQIINKIGTVRNDMAQIAVAQGWISPENSFVISSKAAEKFGEAMIPQEFKDAKVQIVRDIDKADTVPGKIVNGIVSALQHPQAASLYVGGALVEAGLPMSAGAAVTAYTGLFYAGVATKALIQGAQSFGGSYEEIVTDLKSRGMPDAEAREKAMLPAYVRGVITAVIDPLSTAPVLKTITGPAATDVVLRSLTGSVAEGIIARSLPLFESASRDFASGFFDNLFGNMSTELIQTGNIDPSKYTTGAVLEGLVEVGANSAIKAPIAAANAIGDAKVDVNQQQTQGPELKEYVVPQLGYTPTTDTKAIGYTPTQSGPVNTMAETRDNAAQTLADALQIDVDTATRMATNSIGDAAITVLNNESTSNKPNINPDAIITKDAFGTPITYADAIGAITTDTPVINLEIGTKEQRIENADILKGVYEKLNIDPEMQLAPQQQNATEAMPFKERPDIRNLFNADTVFGKPDLEVAGPKTVLSPTTAAQTTPAQATEVKLSTPTDSKTATDLSVKLATDTATETDLAVATDLAIKLQTELQQATDPAVKTKLQQDLDVVTKLVEDIDTKLNVPTDVNVGVTPVTPITPVTTETTTTQKKKTTKPKSPVKRGAGIIEDETGIYDLGPAFTKAKTNYQLAGQFGMATGGAVATSQYDPFGLAKTYTSENSGVLGGSAIFDPKSPFVGSSLQMPKLTVGTTKKQLNYDLAGYPGLGKSNIGYAEGGEVEHNPQFFSEGGLGTLENRFVQGDGDGTSDSVPAMLANGEFVIPADVVSKLGNGSNDAGAGVLDQFLAVIREHAQKHNPKDLPPDSKGPLAYLLDAKKRA